MSADDRGARLASIHAHARASAGVMSVAACGPLILHASQVSARVGWRVVGDWALDSGKFRLRERCACVVGTPGLPTARASLHMHGMCRLSRHVKAATQEGVFSPERSGKRACETVCVTARLERAPSLNRRLRIPVFGARERRNWSAVKRVVLNRPSAA